MKTFKIPENTREISVNETDGRIIIEFVPEDPEFKEGDIVFENGRVMIIKSYPNHFYANTYPKTGGLTIDDEYGLPFTTPTFRLATPAEAQQLFDALAKDGKRWNPDTLKIEELTERDRIRAFLYQRGWEGASEDSIADIEAYIKHREAQR